MIALGLADYAIIACVVIALLLRIVGDVRDVVAASFIKNTMKAFVQRKFKPLLTIIVPLESLEDAKQTVVHLHQSSVSPRIIVVANTSTHAGVVGKMRYFIRKNTLKRAKVVARRDADYTKIAAENVKSGLVVLLPDTARLYDSFYTDTLLAFSDTRVDGVLFSSDVRIDQTLRSGIESLYSAWRQYVRLNGLRQPRVIQSDVLISGLVVRAKYLRQKRSKRLCVIETRRSVVSNAPQPSNRAAWRKLQAASSWVDVATISAIAATTLVFFSGTQSVSFALGALFLITSAVVWWSLGVTRLSWINRLAILLLVPFFIILLFGLILVRIMHRAGLAIQRVLSASRALLIASRRA